MPISWQAPADYSEHDLQKMERMFDQPMYTLLYEIVNLPPRPHSISGELTLRTLREGALAGLSGDAVLASYLSELHSKYRRPIEILGEDWMSSCA